MVRILPLASLAIAAASTVSGLIVPRRNPPPGWRFDILENYDGYHVRYLALDCQGQHHTQFFDECCHPLLATQKLSDRPAQCQPSPSQVSSASAAEPTSSVITPVDPAPEEDECDGGDEEDTTATSHSSTSTHAPSNTQTTTSTKAQAKVTPAPTPAPAGAAANVEAPPPSSKATKTTSKPTSSEAAAPAPSSGSGSGSGPVTDSTPGVNTGGFATFFDQNGKPGACGQVSKDSDFIAAIDQARYGNSGNESPLCGKQVKITNKQNQKTVVVTIKDDCPSCENENSIDLSHGAFDAIADEDTGIVPIDWVFI